MSKDYKLASEGVHPATLLDIGQKPAKNSKTFAILRFRLLDENTEASALLFNEAEKQFLAAVPGYRGDQIDSLQLLGRSAQISVSHNLDKASSKTYANFDLASVEWEQEPPRSPEHEMNPKLVLVAVHHTKSDNKGLAYFRSVGQSQIRAKEFFGDSSFAVATAALRYLFSAAKEKKAQLRIVIDLKPLTQRRELQDEAADARCSLQWQRGTDLKRLLFRGLRTPYVAAKKPSTATPTDDLDELLG